MAITTRSGKGSTLTHGELDTNFTELDTRLVTIEAVDFNNLDARVVVLENEDDALDLRLDTLEAQTLDLRVTSNENRLDAYDVLDLDNRVETLELQTLDARLTVVEGFDLDTRVTAAEGDITSIDSRLTVVEDTLPYQGIVDISNQVTIVDSVVPYTYNQLSIDAGISSRFKVVVPDNNYHMEITGFVNPVAGQEVTIYFDCSAMDPLGAAMDLNTLSMNNTFGPGIKNTLNLDNPGTSAFSETPYRQITIYFDGTEYWTKTFE